MAKFYIETNYGYGVKKKSSVMLLNKELRNTYGSDANITFIRGASGEDVYWNENLEDHTPREYGDGINAWEIKP